MAYVNSSQFSITYFTHRPLYTEILTPEFTRPNKGYLTHRHRQLVLRTYNQPTELTCESDKPLNDWTGWFQPIIQRVNPEVKSLVNKTYKLSFIGQKLK